MVRRADTSNPSDFGRTFDAGSMDEAHFKEIEATMLYVEEARWRAERAVAALTRGDAEPPLIDAAESAKQELSDIHRRLMQGTLFAVPSAQGSL